MDGAMGKEEEVVEAVLTCEGDFHDPELLNHLEKFRLKLKELLLADDERLNLKKVEPWNSVKVTFTIPREAALRLRQLAQSGNEALRQMGVLSVQIQGDSSISLKIVGHNNETTEFMLHTSRTAASSFPSERAGPSNEIASPGPSNEEVTRKNIVDYLIQGPPNLRPNAIFNSILGATAPTTAPFLGTNRGVPTAPESFSGVGSSRPILRPNSMAPVAPLPNSALRGSQPTNFPFAKTSGAFHIPIPHQASAGQSTSDYRNLHTNSSPVNNTSGLVNSSGFQHSGTHNPGATNVFGPIGAKLTAPSNISNNLPPSSSPGFIIDLPPPPPYPHSSSNSGNKPGKQVSATSPLLVNLLQTDPIAVAAGMSSATCSKTVTVGNTSPAPTTKKKKRSKKLKDGVPNSFSNLDDILNKDISISSPMSLSTDATRIPDPSVSFSSKFQECFPGSVLTSHSFSNIRRQEMESTSVSDKSFKPLISDRPFSENSLNNSAFSLSKLNTGNGSAIRTDHVRSSETNGPRELSQELIDSFSKEIAAGKIINPYTGQLEPRDTLPEVRGGKYKDEMISSNFSDVPVSMSQMRDINVLRGLSTVSSSTAALFHSGSTVHVNEKRSSQFPPHRRNFSDSSVNTHKHVYAAKLNSKSDNENFISSISPTLSQSTFMTHQVSTSSLQNQVKGPNSSPVTGPGGSLTKVQARTVLNQHVQSVIPPHTVQSSLLSSGVSESVINPISGSLCSTTLPVTHKDSFVKHLEHNPSLFQLTSCANSNSQTSVPHPSHSSKMFSSSSQNVVQTRPALSQALSSLQASGKFDVSKSISSQHVQAASSDPISCSTKSSFPNLLNSLPEKSHDQQGMSPLEKVSAEGDDNSNHSGLVTESPPENSGTSVLLEHTGVKAENHDSGVGSSSERSDDTPSEPGDGEFRANNSCSESEEGKSAKKLMNCKAEVGNETPSTNTITVGYMMSSIDSVSHLKTSQSKDRHEDLKTTAVSLTTSSSSLKLDSCFDTQVNSLHKQIELSSTCPVSSTDWMGREGHLQPSTYTGKLKLNGPLDTDKEDGFKSAKKEFQNDSQLNGPSSKEVDDLLLTIAGLQDKDDPNPSKNSPAFKRHGLHLQQEVLEEMAKLQQLAASKELVNAQSKLDKDDSSDSLHRSLGNNEDRHDQLPYFDMEDLVNGKLFGNGTTNVDNKTGSNITSIYSKRSSPVNVNMLNHIYAPGLPLPRRLTESVQRLVKPLPASESSMPQMRLCKSPGTGSPRAGTSPNGPNPSRMALLSGTRSPGSSIPKFFTNDKHSLLSGGLDLAGLSRFPPNSLPLSELASENSSGDASSQMLGLTTDLLSRDGQSHGFLSSCHVSPPILTDSLSNTQKMLSQSFPPHKSRDLSNSVSIHDLFSRMQQPHQSSAESLQDSSTHLLKSPDSTMSSHLSQANLQKNQHNTCNSVSQSEPFSQSTFSHSSHTRVTSTETIAESPLSKSAKITYSSFSSPSHSRPASPTTLANSNILESCALPKTNALAFHSAPEAGSVAPHRSKISLNNGSKSSSNQKIAVSSQKNVPYVTLSSSSIAGSVVHSTQSVSSRITPTVCSALLSGSAVGNSPNSSIDKRAVIKSTKPELCSPSRTVNKEFSKSSPITSALGRNLFESVSCDLTTIPHNVVQSSRNKTLDALVSHSSSKSVLDLNHAQDLNIQTSKGQRKNSDSSQGHISPQLNFHSDINPLQSIRTNETPSTSLPAQVVHLDFPHLPPTVSETSISNTMSDHVIPVSQKFVKSPVASSKSHNWNSTPTNPITSAAPFPHGTIPLPKVNSTNTTITSLTLNKKDHQIKSIQRSPSPSLVKEPILETLASALSSSLKKVNEEQNRENKSSLSVTSNSLSVANFNNEVEKNDNRIMTEASREVKKDTDVLASTSEQNTSQMSISKRLALKRGSHLLEGEQNDGSSNCSAAKRFAMEPNTTNECELVLDTNTSNTGSDEMASLDVGESKVISVPDPIPSQQKKGIETSVSVSANSNNESSNSGKELKVSVSAHGSESNVVKSIDVLQCDITLPVSEKVEGKSIPIPSTHVSSENASGNLPVVNEQSIPLVGEACSEQKSSHETENKVLEISGKETNEVPMGSEQISLQGASSKNNDSAVLKEKDQMEKQVLDLDLEENVTEIKDNEFVDDTLRQHMETKDGEMNHDQDSTISTGNADLKLDDGSRKGHRVKRQFYAYVPEKSIDQTYFDTPILSGRTRSRNKPSDAAGNPENAVNHEGTNATSGSSDSQTSAAPTGVKTEVTDMGNKRSTRSLRTKENPQDLTANKRRRLQTRDHR